MTLDNHEKRIARLEALARIDDRIPIYVEHEKDLGTRIAELIAAGALAEADRPRCVFYLHVRHASRWRTTDAAALRLRAQMNIRTPCATWLSPGESPPQTGAGDAGETPAQIDSTTGAC